MQLDRYLPERGVAVGAVVEGREASMDAAESCYPCGGETLEGSKPETDIRSNRVLHEDRYVGASQGVGKLLDGEGVHHCTRAYPQHIDAILQGELHMFRQRDLYHDRHTEAFSRLHHPDEAFLTHALKRVRTGAGLPDAATQHMRLTRGIQLTGSGKQLLTRLHTTRPADDKQRIGRTKPSPYIKTFEHQFLFFHRKTD